MGTCIKFYPQDFVGMGMPYSFGYCRGRVFAPPAPYSIRCHPYHVLMCRSGESLQAMAPGECGEWWSREDALVNDTVLWAVLQDASAGIEIQWLASKSPGTIVVTYHSWKPSIARSTARSAWTDSVLKSQTILVLQHFYCSRCYSTITVVIVFLSFSVTCWRQITESLA